MALIWSDSTEGLHVDTPIPTSVPQDPPEYCIYTTDISLSHAEISMAIPVSLSRESLKMEVVLGTPQTPRGPMLLHCDLHLGRYFFFPFMNLLQFPNVRNSFVIELNLLF